MQSELKLSEKFLTPQMQAHIAGLGPQQREIFASQLAAAGYDKEDIAGVVSAYPPQPQMTAVDAERFVRDTFLSSGNSVQGTGTKFDPAPIEDQRKRERQSALAKAYYGSGIAPPDPDAPPRQKTLAEMSEREKLDWRRENLGMNL